MKRVNKKKSSKWKFKRLIVIHLILTCALLVFFYFRKPLDYLDTKTFLFLNGTLHKNLFFQSFWILLNHKAADWVGDGMMLTLFMIYICSKKKGRMIRVAEFILTTLCLVTVILFVNTYLFRHPLRFKRESPTLICKNSHRISKEVKWIKIKDSSKHSFPGDHATTALTFALFFVYFTRFPLNCFGIAYGIIMSLPRIILGAHWLSDVLIGSFSIALLFFSWIEFTPFHTYFVKRFCSLMVYLKRKIHTSSRSPDPPSHSWDC